MLQEATRKLERTVSSRFGVPAPTIIALSGSSPALTISRLTSRNYGNAPSLPPNPEDAYLLHVMLRDVESYGLKVKGKRPTYAPVGRGGVFLASCRQLPIAHLATPFDLARIYVSKSALEDHTGSAAKAGSIALGLRQQGSPDPVLTHLIGTVLPVFGNGFDEGRLFVDCVAMALLDHLLKNYSGCGHDALASLGGLPPWLERRAKEFIESRIAVGTSLQEVAGQCGLSASHFSKAFRLSTGIPPHRWLLERRVDRAKSLLMTDGITLTEVAARCGFSDATHLSRTFSQLTREPPGSWRRRNRR